MNYNRKKTPYTNIKRDKDRKRLGRKGFFKNLWLIIRNPKTHFVICTYGIGDAILACGYLQAFKKRHGIKHITLVGKERMRYLYEQYEDQYDELCLRTEEDIICMTNAFLFDPACYLFMRWLKRFTPVPVMFHYRNLLVNHIPSVNMVNTFKAVIFGLPQDTPLAVAKPKHVPIDDYIEKYNLPQGKTVILSPAARNTPLLPDAFWESLALRLHEDGYSMVVNYFDYGRDLPHAISLDCDLSVMLALAEHGGHVISLRSGFCDYMSLTTCRLTVLYPQSWDFSHNVLMSEWGIRDNIAEIHYDENQSGEIVTDILRKHGEESAEKGNPVPSEPCAKATKDNYANDDKVSVCRDIGRKFLSIWGILRICLLLLLNAKTHFIVLRNIEADEDISCGLGERFKKENDIAHVTMIVPKRFKHVSQKRKECCDKFVYVGRFMYSCIINAFRFDFAYFHFYEWGRRVTVADAEVFFRHRYSAFSRLVDKRELYETALMPVRVWQSIEVSK